METTDLVERALKAFGNTHLVGDGSYIRRAVTAALEAAGVPALQALLDEAERVVEDVLRDEGCLDVDKCPHWVEWHNTARAFLAKLRKEQRNGND